MMIEPILSFLRTFDAEIGLSETSIVKKSTRYYLLNETTKRLVSQNFFYAGTYLGKLKNRRFFPAFGLLRVMTEGKANRVIVGEKTEWLFVCGRDVFKGGIVTIIGTPHDGDHVLVLNRYSECLGFGRLQSHPNQKKGDVAVKNILDLGDFLRRER
jgi:ribosome biogenesis protein Nip4